MDNILDIITKYKWQIVSAIDMALIVAYLAGLNNRLNRLATASSNFRNVFLNELKGLYPIPSEWPKEAIAIDYRLRQVFPNLQVAVQEFKYFIPWYRRPLFNRAWYRYRLGKDGREIDQQCYHQYMPFSGTSVINGNEIKDDNTIMYKENFKKNVDRLLKYAKQT